VENDVSDPTGGWFAILIWRTEDMTWKRNLVKLGWKVTDFFLLSRASLSSPSALLSASSLPTGWSLLPRQSSLDQNSPTWVRGAIRQTLCILRLGGTMPLFFVYFLYFLVHTFIQSHSSSTNIHRLSLRFLSISASCVSKVSGKNLPEVPSRDLYSGLPYSKQTHN
jgi:hypothetical protein